MEEKNQDSNLNEDKPTENKENAYRINLKELLPGAEKLAEERQISLGKALSLIILKEFRSDCFTVFLQSFLEGYEGRCCSVKMLSVLYEEIYNFSQKTDARASLNFQNINLKQEDSEFIKKWWELLLHGVNNLVMIISGRIELVFMKDGKTINKDVIGTVEVEERKKETIKQSLQRLIKLLGGLKKVSSVKAIDELMNSF